MFRLGFVMVFFVVSLIGYSQEKIYETNGFHEDDLYPYMLYWKDSKEQRTELDQIVSHLEQGDFKTFENGKNMGLFPEPVWFYLTVKNKAGRSQKFWWSFFTHADTIVIYTKQDEKWSIADTLVRQKLMRDRKVRHRALTYATTLQKDQEQSYLVQIVNSRHTQNSFLNFTSPSFNLSWEKEFYWTIASFVGIFLITGFISLIIGIIIKERVFILFFLYMLAVSLLTLYDELMTTIIPNEFLYLWVNRMHPLPLSLIATCLNFYIVDFIFGKIQNTKELRVLNWINTVCLAIGLLFLALYMIFMPHLHSGQTLFMVGWYGSIACIFISITIIAIKVIMLSVRYKMLQYGIPFLLLIVIFNPATYNLNYSGIFSFYQITYPNYFYWFISAEFIFIGFLIGWRYKKNLDHRHKLEIEFAQRELNILNNERKQIARDLHDDLGATINAIKLLVTNSYANDKRLVDTINTASNDIRVFYKKLTQKPIGESIEESIEKLTTTYNSYGRITFNFIFSGDESLLSDFQKENLYKIVSEIFANTLRHAQATEATVQLLIDKDTAQLLVEDNGIGFSVEKAKRGTGMGVKNIFQRVENMKGELHISSGKGNTTYIIEIPFR